MIDPTPVHRCEPVTKIDANQSQKSLRTPLRRNGVHQPWDTVTKTRVICSEAHVTLVVTVVGTIMPNTLESSSSHFDTPMDHIPCESVILTPISTGNAVPMIKWWATNITCPIIGWYVYIHSYSTEFRLANNRNPSYGYIEVLYKNEWGTVCHDSFNQMAGDMICQELGFR